jgi:hypothetical protein
MVNSCAVAFATICFLATEEQIRANCGHFLLFFKRFVRDILGIWHINEYSQDDEQDEEWLAFKEELKTFVHLQWDTNPLSRQAVFLDLNISVNSQGTFMFCTYQMI